MSINQPQDSQLIISILMRVLMARYTDNPPYNPGYSDPSDYYGGGANYGDSGVLSYPTGTVPPPHSHVPLLHCAPPR